MKKYKLSSAYNDYNILAPSVKHAVKQYYMLSNQNPLGLLHYKNEKYLLNLHPKITSDKKYRLKIKTTNVKSIKNDSCNFQKMINKSANDSYHDKLHDMINKNKLQTKTCRK